MDKPRILVAEDEGIIAKDLEGTLKGMGYAVSGTASSGEEAVRKALETRPDLVLMDVVLRGSMDGVAAAEEIRAQSGIPVIFLTAYADENTLQRGERGRRFKSNILLTMDLEGYSFGELGDVVKMLNDCPSFSKL